MIISCGCEYSCEKTQQGDYVISCPLFVRIDGHVFPHELWDEMAVMVLSVWLTTVIDNARKSTTKFELVFFEGAYEIACKKNGDMIQLTCIERTLELISSSKQPVEKRNELCGETVEFICLLFELKKAVSSFIQFLEKNLDSGISVRGLKELRKSAVNLSLLILELEQEL